MKKKITSLILIMVMFITIIPTSTTLAASKPPAPKITSIKSPTKTTIKLKWKKNSKVNGYIVYRKSGKNYKKVATIKSNKTTSYTAKGLKSGKKYTFAISSYIEKNGKNVYSSKSASKSLYTLHTHKYGKWKTTKAATCTTKGQKVKTCFCGKKTTKSIEKKSHTLVIDKAIEATTTSIGLTEGIHCSTCGTVLVKQTVIPKLVSPSESSTFEIKKNDVLKTYSSLYNYNEYSIDYVEIDKKDTSNTTFDITVTIGAVMLLKPEDVEDVPNYIKGYWQLKKDGETVSWNIFTIPSVEELEYREVSFTCKNLEEGEYSLHFTSYI